MQSSMRRTGLLLQLQPSKASISASKFRRANSCCSAPVTNQFLSIPC